MFPEKLTNARTSYPGLAFLESPPTSGSIAPMSFVGLVSRDVAVMSTADGVAARSMYTGFFRVVFGSDTDGVGSLYGLAQASSSSTAPGRPLGDAVWYSLGDGIGVAPMTVTAGGRDRSLSTVHFGGDGGRAGYCRTGDVCV